VNDVDGVTDVAGVEGVELGSAGATGGSIGALAKDGELGRACVAVIEGSMVSSCAARKDWVRATGRRITERGAQRNGLAADGRGEPTKSHSP
jgi:hypothetical protein